VYDSDVVLDEGVVANLEHYGRLAHLQERFTGYGTKWTVLESFMLGGQVRPKDIFVVLDGRDVIANAYSAEQFRARITDLLAQYQDKVVSTRYPPPPRRAPHPPFRPGCTVAAVPTWHSCRPKEAGRHERAPSVVAWNVLFLSPKLAFLFCGSKPQGILHACAQGCAN
jgi:hypothetical protein